MRILIAEDEPIIRKTIELKLKKDGHELIVTCNGREAIAAMDQQLPDLVITDIMMPYSSGLEVVGFVKQKDKKVPVIVLSSMGQEHVVLEAFKLGADDFITKPFSPNELSMRIRRFSI
jgi:DNA-binding response OmpR family regulator